jgi:condensin-2 complex subunit D3
LFHRFLVASADEDDDVASLAQMLLCGPLVSKQPRLFSNQFVESLFVLNRCTAHPIYVAAASMGDGGSGIVVDFDGVNLTGEVGRVRRMQMYQLMLARMSDEEKIGVTARITKEVLGSALEGGNDLNQVCSVPPEVLDDEEAPSPLSCAYNVLRDAFAILSSPDIRVGKRFREEEDIQDPNITVSSSKRMVVARNHLLSKISRKHLIEIIVPILCRLKAILEKSCSMLLKDLMIFLVEVFRLYKDECKEVLANEPTLLQELEYDAKRFQKNQRSNYSPTNEQTSLTDDSLFKK